MKANELYLELNYKYWNKIEINIKRVQDDTLYQQYIFKNRNKAEKTFNEIHKQWIEELKKKKKE